MMSNSEAEYQKIHNIFRPKILRYLTCLVGETDAEDLTQEVLIKVDQGMEDFAGRSQLSTWIYRIATNTALDKLRSPSYKRIIQNCPPDLEAQSGKAEIADQNVWTGEKTPLVESQIFRKEMNDCIQDYIQGLPEDYRTALVLSEFEGLKNSEIAGILGISLGTVKIRLFRARERLKQDLRRNCASYWIEGNEFLPELKGR